MSNARACAAAPKAAKRRVETASSSGRYSGCHCTPMAKAWALPSPLAFLPALAGDFTARVPLIHSDIGTGDSARNARLAMDLAGYLPSLLTPGGVIVSDASLPGVEDMALAPPAGVKPDRYFLYRRS